MKLYRLESFFYRHKFKLVSRFIYRLIQLFFNCVVPPSAVIGKGTQIAHGVGIVIHHDAVIGNECKICQNVTIGQSGVVVGNNCLIGSGAVLLGPIIIGNNVKIGANTVVNVDVPDNCTVVGSKCRIIQHSEN